MRLFLHLILALHTVVASAAVVIQPRSGRPDLTPILAKRAVQYGPGCSNGTYSMTVSPDRNFTTLGFDQFSASIGPGAGPVPYSACLLLLTYETSASESFSVQDLTLHTFTTLYNDTTASLSINYRAGWEFQVNVRRSFS
jgi:Domain of unknown function (DUF4360)